MQGYRTYASLAVALLGALGVGSYFGEGEIEKAVSIAIELFGIFSAAYFRFKATK